VITTVRIGGMHAVHAVRALETALSGVPGIVAIDVRLGIAVVEHDGRATGIALRDAVAAAGFEVRSLEEDSRRLPTKP
jgi:copper chaperone CopZ